MVLALYRNGRRLYLTRLTIYSDRKQGGMENLFLILRLRKTVRILAICGRKRKRKGRNISKMLRQGVKEQRKD